MKEMLNQHIDTRTIEDRELRALVKYEQIIAWHKAGGFQQAAAAYRAQIAEAERQKAVAELRVAQINVITTTVGAYDGKAVRNAQIAQVAAQHQADAAERQAIKEACDEVLALEDIIPADDIDDILTEVSKALGIELPTDADKADICQRGPKSMEELKRQLGPSPTAKTEPRTIARAHWNSKLSRIELWALANNDRFDDSVLQWIDRNKNKPEWAEDALDEETLDLGWKAANDQFDAGKTLKELGCKTPMKAAEPQATSKIDPEQFGRLLEEYKTAVASYASVNTDPCQVTSSELVRRRESMNDHEHRLRTYIETGEIKRLGDGRVFEHNGLKFTMRVGAFENPSHKPAPQVEERLPHRPAPQIEESLLNLLLDCIHPA